MKTKLFYLSLFVIASLILTACGTPASTSATTYAPTTLEANGTYIINGQTIIVNVDCTVIEAGCFLIGSRQRNDTYESTIYWIVQIPCEWLEGEEVGIQPDLTKLFGEHADDIAKLLGVNVRFELTNDGLRAVYKSGHFYVTDQDWNHSPAYNSLSCLVPETGSFRYFVNDTGNPGEWSFGKDVCDDSGMRMDGPYSTSEVLANYTGDTKGSYELGLLIEWLTPFLSNADVDQAKVLGIWDVNGKVLYQP